MPSFPTVGRIRIRGVQTLDYDWRQRVQTYNRHCFSRSAHLLLSYSQYHRFARLHVKPNFTPQSLNTTNDLLRLCPQALVSYVPQCRRTIPDSNLHLCRALHGHFQSPLHKNSAQVCPCAYTLYFPDKIYLCASIRTMGKTHVHKKVLALLCVTGLGFCVHIHFKFSSLTALVFDLLMLRLEHLITSLLAPQRRYAFSAWHGFWL